MVAINKQNETQTIADAVCPKCFREIQFPQIVQQQADRYSRKLRRYFAWCFSCNIGCEVVQFKKIFATENTEDTENNLENNEQWIIHKYQIYGNIVAYSLIKPTGKWVTLNELPEPAPIVLGPGGDFNKPIEIKQVELLKTLRKMLEALCQTIDCMLKAFVKHD